MGFGYRKIVRKFGDEKFGVSYSCLTKSEANSVAEKYRAKGRNARVTKYKHGYHVWVSLQ